MGNARPDVIRMRRVIPHFRRQFLVSLMRKFTLASTAAVLVACSSGPFQNAPAALELSASLALLPSTENLPTNKIGGIFAVDGHRVAKENRNLVYLKPGAHEIKYMCPGWEFVDGFPGIEFEFSLGKRYQLVCVGRTLATVAIEPIG
jgi:hypothetical protein